MKEPEEVTSGEIGAYLIRNLSGLVDSAIITTWTETVSPAEIRPLDGLTR